MGIITKGMGAIMKGAKKRKKTGASPEWTKMRKNLSFVGSFTQWICQLRVCTSTSVQHPYCGRQGNGEETMEKGGRNDGETTEKRRRNDEETMKKKKI